MIKCHNFFIFCLDGGLVVYGSHPLFPPFRIPPTLKFHRFHTLAHIVFVKRIPVSFHSVLSLSLRWFSVHLILHDLFFLYSPNNLQDTFWGTVKHLEEGHIWDTVKHPEEGNFSDTLYKAFFLRVDFLTEFRPYGRKNPYEFSHDFTL